MHEEEHAGHVPDRMYGYIGTEVIGEDKHPGESLFSSAYLWGCRLTINQVASRTTVVLPISGLDLGWHVV